MINPLSSTQVEEREGERRTEIRWLFEPNTDSSALPHSRTGWSDDAIESHEMIALGGVRDR